MNAAVRSSCANTLSAASSASLSVSMHLRAFILRLISSFFILYGIDAEADEISLIPIVCPQGMPWPLCCR